MKQLVLASAFEDLIIQDNGESIKISDNTINFPTNNIYLDSVKRWHKQTITDTDTANNSVEFDNLPIVVDSMYGEITLSVIMGGIESKNEIYSKGNEVKIYTQVSSYSEAIILIKDKINANINYPFWASISRGGKLNIISKVLDSSMLATLSYIQNENSQPVVYQSTLVNAFNTADNFRKIYDDCLFSVGNYNYQDNEIPFLKYDDVIPKKCLNHLTYILLNILQKRLIQIKIILLKIIMFYI